jgi:hypothetical protein
MSRNLVKRGAIMLCILAGLAILLVRRDLARARLVNPKPSAQVVHQSEADSQTRSSGGAVYVGPHAFSPVYEYCYVDVDGRPVMMHQRRPVFFPPQSRPDISDRTFIETDKCQ